ncbi:general transcription factor II-I repeat domain-containing protein 2B-like [Hydra vulgaris]|uniref:General transcription factor II-I repeat domain-containing protein 2B-like n=1 Tax=Hydra vulgaris TaxID=6087 RepID=A0ABM4B0Z5_HYDVU
MNANISDILGLIIMSTKKRKVGTKKEKLGTEKYAVIESDGNPLCLVCSLKLQNNKSSNIERHFEGKHKEFAQKYPKASSVQEELLELLPMKGQTRGKDIAESVLKCLETKNINIERRVSVATDGAPAMIAKNKALVAKSLGAVAQLKNVMEVNVPIVNFIGAKSLNHRIFKALLEEMDFIHKELVTFTAVRWLSRGKTLKRFSECLSKITKFLAVKKYNEEHCKLLKNSGWLQNFYFLLDMTEHFSKLNLKIQGKGNIYAQLLEELITFEQKLQLFLDDISGDQLIYFNNLRNFRIKIISEAEKVDRKQFFEITTTIFHQFASRFHDFKKYQE